MIISSSMTKDTATVLEMRRLRTVERQAARVKLGQDKLEDRIGTLTQEVEDRDHDLTEIVQNSDKLNNSIIILHDWICINIINNAQLNKELKASAETVVGVIDSLLGGPIRDKGKTV